MLEVARRSQWANPVLQEHKYYRSIFEWFRGEDLERINELLAGTVDSPSTWLNNQDSFIEALSVLITTESTNSKVTLRKLFGDHGKSLRASQEVLRSCQRRATPPIVHLDKLIQEGVIPMDEPTADFAQLQVLYFALYHREVEPQAFMSCWRSIRSSPRYREFVVRQDERSGGSLHLRLDELESEFEALLLLSD